MTRIHAQSTWDDDITWSSASRGTEGVLVIHSSGRLVGLIHSRPSSHAWGRDRMERGLIVVIGGVDSVDNCRAAAHDGESGWGQVRGPAVDDAQGGVGECHESPGAAVPAQSVHMLLRRPMWETTRVPGPGNPGDAAEPVVPAAEWGRREAPNRLPVDEIGRVARVRATRGYPQDCPQAVDLWTDRGRGIVVHGARGEVTIRAQRTHRVGRSLWTDRRCVDIPMYRILRIHRETRGSTVSRPVA